jgi:hypothetical protein
MIVAGKCMGRCTQNFSGISSSKSSLLRPRHTLEAGIIKIHVKEEDTEICIGFNLRRT